MAKSASQVLADWEAKTKASGAKYVAGVRACTVNPGELAAAAQDKYAAGVQDEVSSGRYAEGCRSVSPAQWKDACEKTGSARISTGVDKGKAKMAAFLAEFLPQQEAITQEVRAMPSTTLEDRLQRMVAQARKTAELQLRRRR